MHFLVFSDSHGHPENINSVLHRARRYDGIIFLGDGLRDLLYCDADISSVYSVRGNCDFFSTCSCDEPDQRLIEIGGKRIFITHGHRYGVKSSFDSLIYAAAERDADAVLFGHTHDPIERRLTPENTPCLSKPLYLFNPGSISGYEPSFGCMDITLRGEMIFSHGRL